MRRTGFERLEARILAQVAAAEAYVRAGDRDGAVDALFVVEEEVDAELARLGTEPDGACGMVRAGRMALAVRDRAVDAADRDPAQTAYEALACLETGAEALLERIATGAASPSAAWFARQRNAAMDLAALALRAALLLGDEEDEARAGSPSGGRAGEARAKGRGYVSAALDAARCGEMEDASFMRGL